ncbi:MAG: PEGA domain-containing protein [Spirochaetales bacterium]|nr:PEGA domain-containing protein [Spirochaetales bacterium]
MNASRRPVRIIAGFIFAVATAFPLQAQQTPVDTVPIDTHLNWTLGVSQFRTVNVSKQNMYLASSFPLQLREKILHYRTHRLDGEELVSLKTLIVNTELKKEIDKLLALQKTRDESLFAETKEFQKRKINEDYITSSELIRKRISFLRDLDVRTVVVGNEKPIVFKDQNGQLFPAPPFSALQYCDEIGVDALLWGSVEEIQGYLYCELYLFDRIMEKNVFTFKEAGKPQELFESLDKSVPALITAIVGREWADLLVDVEPTFSYIKINGAFAGMGTVEIPDLPPGEITLDIESPGYKSLREKTRVANLELKSLKYHLEKSEEKFIVVNTLPPSANVYFNSLWMGTTPLVAEMPAILTRLEIRLEGFQNVYERIGPAAAATLNIALVKTVIDYDALKSSKRWRYYTSLAAFILSVPFPAFSYGLMRDFYDANKLGEFEFFSASYMFTFFITGALFVNMFYELFRYLNSRDQTVG